MRHRGLLLAVPLALSAALAHTAARAASGATLTIPAQVQAAPGARPMLRPSFSYPEATPFCTMGVDFTWDGVPWLSEFPSKSGSLCLASDIDALAPAGHGGAGAHEVCASAGPQYRDCKTVTVVLVSGLATPSPGPSPRSTGSAAPTTLAPVLAAPSATPAAGPLAPIAGRLPAQSSTGLILLAVGGLGLLLVLVRRLLRRRRHRPRPLPSPDNRR